MMTMVWVCGGRTLEGMEMIVIVGTGGLETQLEEDIPFLIIVT